MNFLSYILLITLNTIKKALHLGKEISVYDRDLSRNLLLKDITKNSSMKIKTDTIIKKRK